MERRHRDGLLLQRAERTAGGRLRHQRLEVCGGHESPRRRGIDLVLHFQEKDRKTNRQGALPIRPDVNYGGKNILYYPSVALLLSGLRPDGQDDRGGARTAAPVYPPGHFARGGGGLARRGEHPFFRILRTTIVRLHLPLYLYACQRGRGHRADFRDKLVLRHLSIQTAPQR